MNSRLMVILFATTLLTISCQKEVSQEELIRNALQIKLEQWEEEQLASCKEKAMQRAQEYVDSMMIVTSLDKKLDTIPKPPKPMKPPKPAFRTKPDTVIVDPILKKNN